LYLDKISGLSQSVSTKKILKSVGPGRDDVNH
jgi:hypothetical protein